MTQNDKHENFKRVASKRTEKILSAIRLLKNCSNKKNYYYTHSDVAKIFNAINHEIREARLLYASKNKKTFKL